MLSFDKRGEGLTDILELTGLNRRLIGSDHYESISPKHLGK